MVTSAIILATRDPHHQSNLTYNRNHAMLPAAGKPLVARNMDRLYRLGIRNYTIILGDEDGVVASYLNPDWKPDVTLNISLQKTTESLSETIYRATKTLTSPYLLSSYNSFSHSKLPEQLVHQFDDSNDELMLGGSLSTLSQSKNQKVAIIDGARIGRISKQPDLINEHYYLCDMAVFNETFVKFLKTYHATHYTTVFLDLADKFISQTGKSRLIKTGWLLQINTDRDLLTLNRKLLEEDQDTHILSELPYTVQVTSPVRIDPQVNVGQGAHIGPNVYLERGCSIGQGATVRNAIVLNRVNIPATTTIENAIASTRHTIALPSHH